MALKWLEICNHCSKLLAPFLLNRYSVTVSVNCN
jgi:hypothetical protein